MLADTINTRIIVLDLYNVFMDNQGQIISNKSLKKRDDSTDLEQIVLEKDIFSNIFEKDIRRIYIYKKAEMLAKAIHLITPAFKDSKVLKDRIQKISVDIVDAAILPPAHARETLARELLALISLLRMAKTGGMLSEMNADIIVREAHALVQEASSYEEPKVSLEETPTLATLARLALKKGGEVSEYVPKETKEQRTDSYKRHITYKGHTESKEKRSRREAILSILKSKGPSYIKDISTIIRDVSEKTIQRELQALVLEGTVSKIGERRWTTYTYIGDMGTKVVAAEPHYTVDLEESLG